MEWFGFGPTEDEPLNLQVIILTTKVKVWDFSECTKSYISHIFEIWLRVQKLHLSLFQPFACEEQESWLKGWAMLMRICD